MKKRTVQRQIFILTIVLAVLLAMTGTALAGTVIYKHFKQSSIEPSMTESNIITTERSGVKSQKGSSAEQSVVSERQSGDTVLKLYRNHAEDSIPFQLSNMFPGDSQQQPYLLQVSYKGSLTVNFHAEVRAGYENLAEVLNCTVSLRDEDVLYDGLMRDMPTAVGYQLPQSKGETVDLIYDIRAYLDTSVGNEYMNKELLTDFYWWIETDVINATQPDSSGTETKPESGELIAPQTGDDSNLILWAGALAGIALILALWLLFGTKRKKEDQSDE